jgi:spatacsin
MMQVELIILAHYYYEMSACLDGIDVLVSFVSTRVDLYVFEGEFTLLARLVTGVGNFQRLRFILDVLIEHGCLQLLLQKKPFFDVGIETSSVSVRGFCMAVLSALKRFNALDQDAFIQVLYDNPEQCRLLSRAFAKTNDPVMYHLWIRGLLITILPYTSFSAALISTFGIPTR